MKRLKNLVFSLFILVGFIFILAACGKTKLPTNKYEKVKFAFDGVEKSFKKPKVDNSNDYNKFLENNIRYLMVRDTSDTLNTIKSVYVSGDNQGDIIDEIEYDAPPMIQFQYLKKVLEKTGKDYNFNKKYNDIVTGSIYMDMETGKGKDKEEAYKANYAFDLAIKINIDSNNLITADVSFDISITQNNKTYTTKWYVGFILDYDMNSTSSNYTLTMVNENDEKNIPYLGGYVYEYDYVEVKEGKIKEWRKFCYETDTLLVKDATHTSFNDYINDDIEFEADTCKWYYDGALWKVTQRNQNKENTLANAFFDLGLNDSDINPTTFFNETSTKNAVITTCYSEFSKIAKQDIILSIVGAGEEHSDHSNSPAGIKAYANDTNTIFDHFGVPDITIRQLFDGYDDEGIGRVAVQLWYLDINGGNISQITNMDSIAFKISYYVEGSQDDFMDININDSLKNIISYYQNNKRITVFDERTFKLQFSDNNTGVTGSTIISYTGEMPEAQKEKFPDTLISLGLPVYDASYDMTNATFSFNGSTMTLTITNSDSDHANEYITDIQKNGFTLLTDLSTNTVKVFKKDYGNDKDLFVTFDISSSAYTLKAELKNKEVDSGGGDEPGGDEPGDEEQLVFTIVGSMNDWSETSEAYKFTKKEDGGIYTIDLDLHQNDKFKIVKDLSWGNGSYGYSNISNIADEYPVFFEAADGKDDNILVIAKNVKVTITIAALHGQVDEIRIEAHGNV